MRTHKLTPRSTRTYSSQIHVPVYAEKSVWVEVRLWSGDGVSYRADAPAQ